MSKALEQRIKAIERQISTVRAFITEPRGVFETVDALIRNFRYANKELLRVMTIGGQVVPLELAKGPILRRIRDIFRRLRERVRR